MNILGLLGRYERLSAADKAHGRTRCRHGRPACAGCVEKSWEYVEEGSCSHCGKTRARVYEDVLFHTPMLECQWCGEVRKRKADDSSARSPLDLAPLEELDEAITAIAASPRSRPSSLAERSFS